MNRKSFFLGKSCATHININSYSTVWRKRRQTNVFVICIYEFSTIFPLRMCQLSVKKYSMGFSCVPCFTFTEAFSSSSPFALYLSLSLFLSPTFCVCFGLRFLFQFHFFGSDWFCRQFLSLRAISIAFFLRIIHGGCQLKIIWNNFRDILGHQLHTQSTCSNSKKIVLYLVSVHARLLFPVPDELLTNRQYLFFVSVFLFVVCGMRVRLY